MLWLYFFLMNCAPVPQQSTRKILIEGFAQGTSYHITYYAADSVVKKQQIDSLFNVLDNSLSIYKPNSVISRFNRSRKSLRIDKHLETVVVKAKGVWKDTDGVFDITVQPLVKAWGFGNETISRLPDSPTINSILPCVGTEMLRIAKNRLYKQQKCVTIDVNGIAQGYSVDVIADFLEQNQLASYLVEIGGEIRIKGNKPDGEKMKIGIEAPGGLENETVMQKIITLNEGAVTTSGNYRKFHESEGKRINHIINPVTGYPVENELISVTVIAKDAITADAYDNTLLAMGLKEALAFVEKREDMAAFFIYKTNDGKVTDTASSRFYQYLVDE
ncbi:MAG: FAD:protein FMN transferase [Chitinophagaceae bacterium]|nr:FAD:protein FMN transferase [Chitinophagaceae bacterium]MCW5927427.1 FAD:protein FMN transferase [Chitinophagaceae bacterium]